MSTINSFNINGQEIDISSNTTDSIIYNDDSSANFNIGDDSGNVLVEFKDGHIKTKNFDSRDALTDTVDYNIIEDVMYPFTLPTIPAQNGTDLDNQLINLNTAMAQDIYDLYDDLINRSDGYIQKEILGKDSSGEYDIWRLTLKPTCTLSIGEQSLTSRKVFIDANVHGRPWDPIDATFTTFWLCKFLVDDYKTNDVAMYLRNNYTFIIIPQANPWAMDNNSYPNINKVNINRNYDYNFVANYNYGNTSGYGDTFSGSAPFSEKETQYIYQTLMENSDLYAWFDIHSYGDSNKTKAFYVIKGDTDHSFNRGRSFRVFQHTQSLFDGINVKYFDGYDDKGWGPAYGSKVLGIWCPHLEMGCRMATGDTSAFTSDALTTDFYNLIGFLMFKN